MIKYAKFEFEAGDKHVIFNCPQDITTVAPRVTKGRTIGGFSNYVKALKAHIQAQGLSDEFIFMLTPAEYKKHRGEMLAATGKVIVLDNTSITLCKDSEALEKIKDLSDKNQFLIRDYKTSFSSSETYLTSVKNQMSGLLWESSDRKTVLLDFKSCFGSSKPLVFVQYEGAERSGLEVVKLDPPADKEELKQLFNGLELNVIPDVSQWSTAALKLLEENLEDSYKFFSNVPLPKSLMIKCATIGAGACGLSGCDVCAGSCAVRNGINLSEIYNGNGKLTEQMRLRWVLPDGAENVRFINDFFETVVSKSGEFAVCSYDLHDETYLKLLIGEGQAFVTYKVCITSCDDNASSKFGLRVVDSDGLSPKDICFVMNYAFKYFKTAGFSKRMSADRYRKESNDAEDI